MPFYKFNRIFTTFDKKSISSLIYLYILDFFYQHILTLNVFLQEVGNFKKPNGYEQSNGATYPENMQQEVYIVRKNNVTLF